MTILLFAVVILMMVVGHILKNKRWAQFIEVYEKPDSGSLLNALSIGHTINAVFPFRMGYFIRIYLSAKKLKNSYMVAIATVIVDIYLDIIAVGSIFLALTFLGVGDANLQKVAHFYALIFTILLPFTLLCTIYKKYLKCIIQKVASIFNSNIELRLLYVSYSVIASFKDISHKLNKCKLVILTIGMWSAYFTSYVFFAKFVSSLGIQYTVSGIFTILFSKNCLNIYLQSGLTFAEFDITSFPVIFFAYMVIPLIIIWLISFLYEKGNFNAILQEECISLKILPHLNANDRLAFLESYFSNNDKENIELYLKVNRDVSIIQDYSAGSNATTLLCMNQSRTFYRKYAFGSEADKLNEQITWLETHGTTLPLPKILCKNQGTGYTCYDMEYSPSSVGFFQFMHTMPYDISWNILNRGIENIHKKLHTVNARSSVKFDIEEYIKNKVQRNIDALHNDGRYLRQLQEYEFLYINGAKFRNLSYYEPYLSSERLREIFKVDSCSDIHGDLTIENIICKQGDTANFYFIDPNTGNRHDTPFLDYSKLLQSLHGGYEFLTSVKDVEINNNQIRFLFIKSSAYTEIYKKYHELLQTMFSQEELKSIYYHEIVHWLRLMPYKIRKIEKLAVVFYAGMLMIMDDILKLFPE